MLLINFLPSVCTSCESSAIILGGGGYIISICGVARWITHLVPDTNERRFPAILLAMLTPRPEKCAPLTSEVSN